MSVDDTDTPTTPVEGETVTVADPPRPRTCYSRFWVDLTGTCRCIPSFQGVDVIYNTDGSTNTKIIDIPASFSPPIGMLPKDATNSAVTTAKVGVIAWKVIVLGLEIATLTLDLLLDDDVFWLAYMSNWAFLLALTYSLLSLVNTVFPVSGTTEDGKVSTRTSVTWAFFTLAAHAQPLVTVLYWTLDYPGGVPRFVTISKHAIIFGLVWIDGFGINRIPIRLRHWLEMHFPLYLIFCVWTVLQSPLVFGIETPWENDNDRIYNVLDWEGNPGFTAGLLSGLLFIFTPVIQLILWGLSLAGRKYVDNNDEDEGVNKNGEAVGDQEVA